MPAEAAVLHGEAAELDEDVRRPGDLRQILAPERVDLVAPAGILADTGHAADVVQDEGRRRQLAHHVGDLPELSQSGGDVERQPERRALRHTLTERRLAVHAPPRRTRDHRVRIPGAGAADALQAVGRRPQLCLQHGADPRAGGHVGIADDAGRHLRPAVGAGRAHGRLPIGELDLANVLHRLGNAGAKERQMLDEHRRDHVVAAGVDLGLHVVGEVAPLDPALAPVPEVVVRIADGEVGLERRLLHLCEPCIVLGHASRSLIVCVLAVRPSMAARRCVRRTGEPRSRFPAEAALPQCRGQHNCT